MDTPSGLPIAPIDLTKAFGIDTAKTGAGAGNDAAQAATMAKEFESMLLLQMVKQMRQSLLSEEDKEEGFGNETMTDTFDVEFARYLAEKGGIGLAKFIKQQVTPEASKTESGKTTAATDTPAAAAPALKATATAIPQRVAGPTQTISRVQTDDTHEALSLPLDTATTSKFGWRGDPFHGRQRFHSGVDLRAAYGTEVPAAAPGRVTFAGERGGYGNLVVIQHDDGVETRYAHLAAADVREGESVTAGQVIGRVGSTGRSTGPHLHFEVLVNGARVDPELAAGRNFTEFKFVRAAVD